MKKLSYAVLLILLMSVSAIAQPQQRFERIHAIKVAFITDKVHLSSEQAEHFWPIYNDYEKELREMRHSEDKYEDNLEFQEAVLNLRKKYRSDFLKVISQEQLNQLYMAERDFKRLLIQQLRDHRGGGGMGNRPHMD